MQLGYLENLWYRASRADRTLAARPSDLQRLARKRVPAAPYSRRALFDRMTRGAVSLFHGVPIEVAGARKHGVEEALTQGMRESFPPDARARVQLGPKASRSVISIPRLLAIWERKESIVSTTDLHFRETPFEGRIAADSLSNFNLLCAASEIVALEMMTLVMSSAGNVTDSHSDDSDGSNHCFVGKKLWLAWDTHEGRAAGLQDVSHDDVTTKAAFDLRTYLSLASSRWWTVCPGQTLFLPGHLTHKVITLDAYIGFGSFHVSFPGYLRTITRWILHHTTDVTEPTLREINGIAIRQLRKLGQATPHRRALWGTNMLPTSLDRWTTQTILGRERVLKHPVYRAFVAAAF